MDKYIYTTISRKLYDTMARRILLFSLYNFDGNNDQDYNAVYENSLAEILWNRIIITVFPEVRDGSYIVYSFSVV